MHRLETFFLQLKDDILKLKVDPIIFFSLLIFSFLIFKNNVQIPFTSDGISYVQVAERFASGDLKALFNGYWSPILPILILPFVLLGFEPILSVYFFLQLFFYGFLILVIKDFFIKNNVSFLLKVIFFAFLPFLYFVFQYSAPTPDFVNLIFLTSFILYLVDNKPKEASFVKLGLYYILLSLVRYYNGFAIIFVIICWFILRYEKEVNFLIFFKKKIAPFIIIVGSFLLIWTSMVYFRYGVFQPFPVFGYHNNVSTVDKVNHPLFSNGIVKTFNPEVPVWYDPIYYWIGEWSHNPKNYFHSSLSSFLPRFNPKQSLDLFVFSIGFLLVIVFTGLILGKKQKISIFYKKTLLFFLFSLAYISGYFRHFIEVRFIIILFLAILFVFVGFLESFFKVDLYEINTRKKIFRATLSLLAIFFLISPFVYSDNFKKDSIQKIIYQEYLLNKTRVLENKMVAGIVNPGISDYDGWDQYNNLAYFLRYNFRNIATKEQIKDNKNTNWSGMVDYYISFVPIDEPKEFNLFLDSEIYLGKNTPSIYVYK